MEKGQTLKAANSATRTHHVKTFDTVFILPAFRDYPSTYHIPKDFEAFYSCGIIPSSPIYLQNLSILC